MEVDNPALQIYLYLIIPQFSNDVKHWSNLDSAASFLNTGSVLEIGIVCLPALFSFYSSIPLSFCQPYKHKCLTNMVDFRSWMSMEQRTGRRMKERKTATKVGDWLRD